MPRTLSLIPRNLVFTVTVPGLGGAWVPWWILTRHGDTVTPAAWEAVPVIGAGTALYVWCVWNFAAVGRGTPGPWDAPSRVVAAGPYRWVRNPIYIAALLIVLAEAWLFMPVRLRAYAGTMASSSTCSSPERTGAAPPLRQYLPGVPAHGPALDSPPVGPRLERTSRSLFAHATSSRNRPANDRYRFRNNRNG